MCKRLIVLVGTAVPALLLTALVSSQANAQSRAEGYIRFQYPKETPCKRDPDVPLPPYRCSSDLWFGKDVLKFTVSGNADIPANKIAVSILLGGVEAGRRKPEDCRVEVDSSSSNQMIYRCQASFPTLITGHPLRAKSVRVIAEYPKGQVLQDVSLVTEDFAPPDAPDPSKQALVRYRLSPEKIAKLIKEPGRIRGMVGGVEGVAIEGTQVQKAGLPKRFNLAIAIDKSASNAIPQPEIVSYVTDLLDVVFKQAGPTTKVCTQVYVFWNDVTSTTNGFECDRNVAIRALWQPPNGRRKGSDVDGAIEKLANALVRMADKDTRSAGLLVSDGDHICRSAENSRDPRDCPSEDSLALTAVKSAAQAQIPIHYMMVPSQYYSGRAGVAARSLLQTGGTTGVNLKELLSKDVADSLLAAYRISFLPINEKERSDFYKRINEGQSLEVWVDGEAKDSVIAPEFLSQADSTPVISRNTLRSKDSTFEDRTNALKNLSDVPASGEEVENGKTYKDAQLVFRSLEEGIETWTSTAMKYYEDQQAKALWNLKHSDQGNLSQEQKDKNQRTKKYLDEWIPKWKQRIDQFSGANGNLGERVRILADILNHRTADSNIPTKDQLIEYFNQTFNTLFRFYQSAIMWSRDSEERGRVIGWIPEVIETRGLQLVWTNTTLAGGTTLENSKKFIKQSIITLYERNIPTPDPSDTKKSWLEKDSYRLAAVDEKYNLWGKFLADNSGVRLKIAADAEIIRDQKELLQRIASFKSPAGQVEISKLQ